MSEEYVHDDSKIFYVIKKVSNDFKITFDSKSLEDVILKLGKNNIILTNIVEVLDGLRIPYLKYILSDYKTYNIINGEDKLTVTEEGKEYIENKIKDLSDVFKKKADDIIKSKNYTSFKRSVLFGRLRMKHLD
ncbi:Uncharacterised protein [Candidatus Tiddalikarchaeum anstoanum]|nr:Uncharacterised protein [Candidatus Tiddalikarchaeum anstoanum]